MKKILPVFLFLVLFVTACAPAQGVAQTLVEFPGELQAFLGTLVALGVGLLLRGRVSETIILEIAAIITGALVSIIGIVLGLIPGELQPLVSSVLMVLVVLLGGVTVVKLFARKPLQNNGLMAKDVAG